MSLTASTSTANIQGYDPRTGKAVGAPVPPTTAEELDRLVGVAAEAAQWLADLDLTARAGLLRVMAGALRDAGEELVGLADAETALGPARLTGELARTVAQLELLAAAVEGGELLEVCIDEANSEAVPPHGDLRRMLVPLGPVGVFAASNFPFAFSVAGGDTASALAAGCPVVVKVHPSHPGLSMRTADVLLGALRSYGAHPGLLSLVAGTDAGVRLVQHPAIKAVGFTGSASGGAALKKLADERPQPIPFYGELGSINPVVLTEAAVAARGEQIAAGLVGSYMLGSGQFCTKPGLVLLPAGSGFEKLVTDAARRAPAPAPLLNARIRDSYQSGIDKLAEVEGVEVLLEPTGAELDGFAVEAGLVAADAASFLAKQDVVGAECFGPVTVLVPWNDEQELLTLLDNLEGSLTGTLHAEDDDPQAAAALARLVARCGRVLVNGWPTGVAVTWSQHHGGPWPATSSPLHTSVGVTAVRRFQRPVTFQDVPDALLPAALRRDNPLGIPRRVNGTMVFGG
jgi:NADP-dependent aldehyde dehydrogenase